MRLDRFGRKLVQLNSACFGSQPRGYCHPGLRFIFCLDYRPTGMHTGFTAPIEIYDMPVDHELLNNVMTLFGSVC